MGYFLYRLEFTTALHIGSDSGGVSLDNAQMTIHADTLFAALCCEAVKRGKIDKLVNYFVRGQLCISDALPYHKEELYLPKPILFVGNQQQDREEGLKKKWKSLQHLPLSLFEEYLHGLGDEKALNPEEIKCDFGQMTTQTRVFINGQDEVPLPYHVASWRFAADCGLYIILRSELAEATQLFEELLHDLAWVGIGGKQSSGWGKFIVKSDTLPPELKKILDDNKAEYHMLLGTGLPEDAELEDVLQGGWYSLVRRGGFVRSESYSDRPLKKRTIHMLSPGSCLRRRFKGEMFDLSQEGSHPVWRSGNTLFVGVNL